MTPIGTTSESLASRARLFEIAATLAAALLVLAALRQAGVAALAFGLIEAVRLASGAAVLEALDAFLRNLIPLLPTFILLSGIWAARGMFGRVARGEVFSPANSRAISAIGSALMWGALAAMVVVPAITSLIDGGRGLGVRIETQSLILMIIGGAVTLLGGMMARAQDENAALRSELGDFV